MIKNRLVCLREKMKAAGIDAYLVLSEDFHGSESVGDYFKCREYISGFNGSAGSVLVTATMAGLWTDGRYFLQANEQLKGSSIELFRMEEEGVPTINEFLKTELKRGQCLGFDARAVSAGFVEELRASLEGEEIRFCSEHDLIGEIWSQRPERSKEPVVELDVKYAGQSRQEKLEMIRTTLKNNNADYFILSTLDDIAWLFNLRGNDADDSPVFLAYAVVTANACILFGNGSSFSPELRSTLEEVNATVSEYEAIYSYIKTIPAGNKVLLDRSRINYAIVSGLSDKVTIQDEVNPTRLLKAIKNATEVQNVREAHIRDGVAVTKFLFWLKHQIGKETITERSGAEKLESFRKQQKHYQGPSFAPIFGYQEHGAIVHYSATKESDAVLKPEGFILMDTGGQYPEGTTDITRTVALGPLTKEQKIHYTAVLRGNLNLAGAKFLHGCVGANLDYLARQPLWEKGLDYKHGTGHGVGYFLNVHEGPNNIRWKIGPRPQDHAVLEEGMITSDEPGLYLEGAYGIRLENLILCKIAQQNAYGKFMQFETLTLVPFDRDSIDADEMSSQEKQLLNAYHKKVYETLAPFMNEEERSWLLEETKVLL